MKTQHPPTALLGYVLGTAGLVLWSLLPSEVKTTYSWPGALLELVLLFGLFSGVNLCRWLLIVIGAFAALGSLALQSPPLEFVATTWSILALMLTALLFVPSVRRYTSSGPF
jgi:hypothetical protein